MTTIIGTFPTTLVNGTVEDATQVMALFNFLKSQTNSNACPATTGVPMLKGDGFGGTTAAIPGVDYVAAGGADGDSRYPMYAGVAGGSADALTGLINPCGTSALYNGMMISVDAAAANATTNPTFNLTLNAIATGPYPIKKYALGNLVAGDIPGAGHRMLLGWNDTSSVWEYMNPMPPAQSGVTAGDTRYSMFAGTAGGSADALTGSINPCGVSSLYDGMMIRMFAASANTTTSPTLNLSLNGTPTGAKTIKKLAGAALVAGDIAGYEAGLILSYVAAGAYWELMNPTYSGGGGGGGIGIGQTWTDYSASYATTRVPGISPSYGTAYQNTTGAPILVTVSSAENGASGSVSSIQVDQGSGYITVASNDITSNFGRACVTTVVPNLAHYKVMVSYIPPGSGYMWAELR